MNEYWFWLIGLPEFVLAVWGTRWLTHPDHRETEHDLALFGELSVHRRVLYEKIGKGPHLCHWGCGRILEWGGVTGIVSDHLDGNVLNNNPENLVPSCTSCNMRRGLAGNPPDWTSQVTHCPQGHEYTPENTYIYQGGKSCKECSRERTRQWRRKQVGM